MTADRWKGHRYDPSEIGYSWDCDCPTCLSWRMRYPMAAIERRMRAYERANPDKKITLRPGPGYKNDSSRLVRSYLQKPDRAEFRGLWASEDGDFYREITSRIRDPYLAYAMSHPVTVRRGDCGPGAAGIYDDFGYLVGIKPDF